RREAGTPGLQASHAMGEYRTFPISTGRGKRGGSWRRASDAAAAEIVAFHNARAARYQFSPVLTEGFVRALTPALSRNAGEGGRRPGEGFFVYQSGGALHGVAALWDPRAFKQVVARRCRPPKLVVLYTAC